MPELLLDFHADSPRVRGRIGRRALAALHWTAVSLLVAATMQILYWSPGGALWLDGLGAAAVAVAALLAAWILHAPLLDFLGELSYRDKFLLFIAHLLVLSGPRLFGFEGWALGFALVMAMLCLQAVDALGFARIYALSLLLAAAGVVAPPYPPFWLVAAWGGLYLLCLRTHYTAFRVLRHGDGPGPRLGAWLWETTRSCAPPVLVAGGAALWLAGRWAGDVRAFAFEGSRQQARPTLPTAEVASALVWDLVFLVLLVAVAIIAVKWFEKHLRFKGRASSEEDEEVLAAGEGAEPLGGAPPREASIPEGRDPRGRVIAALRIVSEGLAKAKLSRARAETAAEYLARLGRLASRPASSEAALFNRACFSSFEVSEAEASAFEESIAAAGEAAREARARSLAASQRNADG